VFNQRMIDLDMPLAILASSVLPGAVAGAVCGWIATRSSTSAAMPPPPTDDLAALRARVDRMDASLARMAEDAEDQMLRTSGQMQDISALLERLSQAQARIEQVARAERQAGAAATIGEFTALSDRIAQIEAARADAHRPHLAAMKVPGCGTAAPASPWASATTVPPGVIGIVSAREGPRKEAS
jgi:hypothetical protein